MSLSLSVTDAGDGTGGTLTVTGSDPATTVTAYRAVFRGQEGPLTWAVAGTRTGDGTIAVGGPTGSYWLWYAAGTVGGNPAISPVVLQSITDGTYAAVRTRCQQAIIDRIKLLALDTIDGRVWGVIDANSPAQSYPGVVVFRDIVPDLYLGGTNLRDDVGYPFQVVAGDIAAGENAPVGKWDLWNERISRAFRWQRLPGVPEVDYCLIEPARALQPAAGQNLPKIYQGMAVAMTVRCVSRELRGLGT